MASLQSQQRSVQPSKSEVAAWATGVVLGEWFLLPGLGLVIAVVLAFTRLRGGSRAVRWGMVALGVAVLALHIMGAFVIFQTGLQTTPATRVQ
jgi:hypothetical protein